MFLAFQDAYLDNGKIVRPNSVYTDLIEAPDCGFRMVTWAAEHPERGWERGVMLASRTAHPGELDARNIVAEVLWGRGYTGKFQVVAIS